MRRKLLVVLALSLLFSFGQTPYVFAVNQPIMTLEEVERLIDSSPNREVAAHFKSVERGTRLQAYNIILRGVYKEPGLKVIVFITSHRIAAGMSGSPVFVGNKKIGALAYNLSNFSFNNYSWGGISPISLMMEEAESNRAFSSESIRAFNYMGMRFEPIAVGYKLIPGLESLAGGKFIITTSSTDSTTLTGTRKKPVLKAGMPIVVDLVEWTDEKGETTAISAMGTVTHVGDDGKIFAFGHPFLNSRSVAYSFRTAEVMGTVFSQYSSYKLSGKMSETLGTITFDAAYGIYGSTSLDELKKIHHFSLEFKAEGRSLHRFDIKVADSILTPLLVQAALKIIGQTNGAPLPQEAGVTQIETRVDLKGYKPVAWKELFTPEMIKFGPSTIFTSSYDMACEAFFARIYSPLFSSRYDFKISNASVSVNFISGGDRVLKLGSHKFPNKVVWGINPVLEILFVSQDNSIAIAGMFPVKIDWDKVGKPVYKETTLDTEKENEKIIRGVLKINSATMFFNTLDNSERQNFIPEYFLGPEDFLDNISRYLAITNQKIFVKVSLRSRSGLSDEIIAQAEDIMPKEAIVEDGRSEWYVMTGGLTERKTIMKRGDMVIHYLDLPHAPDGYVFDQIMMEIISFEVVLEQ